jgi:hypothetical protein
MHLVPMAVNTFLASPDGAKTTINYAIQTALMATMGSVLFVGRGLKPRLVVLGKSNTLGLMVQISNVLMELLKWSQVFVLINKQSLIITI